MHSASLYFLEHVRAEIEALQGHSFGELNVYSRTVIEDRIVWLDEEVLEELVGLNVDEQGMVGAACD